MTRQAAFGMIRASALSAALFLAGAIVPILGALAMLFAPIPIIDHVVGRPGHRWRAIAIVAIVTGLVTLAAGWWAGVAYVVTFGAGSVLICYMLAMRKRFEVIVVAASLVMLALSAIAALIAVGSPAALADALRNSLSAGMAHGESAYKLLGIKSGLSAEAANSVLNTTVRLSPALVALSAAFTVLINLAVFSRWLNRDRLDYRLFGDMVRWSTPDWLIWVLLASGFALFVPIPAMRTAALDGFVCVAAIYFCQGLAIMAFYFKRLSMPKVARGLIYFVTGIQPVLAAIVCAAGVFDLWVDFRRLKPPSQEAGSFGDYL